MDTNFQYQNPNPNPNQEIINQPFDDYYTFEDGFGEDIFLKNTVIPAENIVNESSNSSRLANNMQHRSREKKYKSQSECRFVFRTKSNMEIMDDGFKWRKYGKKVIKNSPNPRNYFKCSDGGCNVKKRVERDRDDSRYVITTYEGVHNHECPNCVVYCNNQMPTHEWNLHQPSSLSFSSASEP
ncbi:unnamed protein product [Fraxinus pennsylvanica]|uniref:WRKY domain-containing protein n=1 Tax=Fraxinus pennsylvanica TaxID=56036 RepID=A0AAD1ZC52_9LAMI|nr:unnamed protein product [Fraxinus pennsylvanica]